MAFCVFLMKYRRSNKQTKSVNDKAKRELADSMRRFSKREEMAERMSAFQPKKLLPKSWIDKDKPPPKEMKEESPPVKENVDNNIIEDESKAEKQNKICSRSVLNVRFESEIFTRNATNSSV